MVNEQKILFENIKNFRFLLTEAVGGDVIERAIQNHEYLYIYYKGDESNQMGYRTIRPYVLGVSTAGNDVIRAWQEKGKSASYSLAKRGEEHDFWTDDHDSKIKPGWRMFRLDKIGSALPTGQRFNNRDGTVIIPPDYKEGSDKDMSSIKVYVSTKRQPDFVPRTPSERPERGRYKRFVNANTANRRITADDIVKLYDIAKRVYKKAANRYIVAINDDDMYELIDVGQKNYVPQNAIVGNLPNLYDSLVNTTKPDEKSYNDKLNQVQKELKESELPSIPFERKPFFKI